MRSFAAFLDRKTVLWGSAPFESDRIRFNTMWMHLDAHITSDDVRAFAAWLDEHVRAAATITPAMRFPTKMLFIDIRVPEEDEEKRRMHSVVVSARVSPCSRQPPLPGTRLRRGATI